MKKYHSDIEVHLGDAKYTTFYTVNDFWTCSCKKDAHRHRKTEGTSCPRCGDDEDDCGSPDSDLNELRAVGRIHVHSFKEPPPPSHTLLSDGRLLQIWKPGRITYSLNPEVRQDL